MVRAAPGFGRSSRSAGISEPRRSFAAAAGDPVIVSAPGAGGSGPVATSRYSGKFGYARGKLSAVGGAQLGGVDLFSFQGALKERGIPRNYTLHDLHDDMEAPQKLFPE